MDGNELEAMLADDDFGLLEMEPEAAVLTEDDRLIAKFAEITEFVRENEREPEANPAKVSEMTLALRLKAIREDDLQRELLQEQDELDLLTEPEPPQNIEEVIASDDFELLDADGPDIHQLTHVPEKVTTMPDEISQRKPAEDFEKYEPLLVECQAELRSGDREILPFKNEQQIEAGRFYVLKGVLLYVDEVGERSRETGKTNARLRLIFENGTESDMLLRSLAAELYKDGRRVTESKKRDREAIQLMADTPMASVYVLRTLSEDPQLAPFGNLHKIGSTKQRVEDRISGSAKDATFLGAPVEIAAVYKVPEGTEATFEKLLHKAFADSRLDIWFEKDGRLGESATEWFDVPLTAIDQAIDMIEAETISSHVWNRETGQFHAG